MPKNPDDDGLRDRLEKLETKIDNHTVETSKLDRSLAALEPKIDNHTTEIRKLDQHLGDLRKVIEDRTSASRTVTWTQLGALLVVLLLPIGGGAAAVFNSYVFPTRVETVVSDSTSLNSRFGDIIDEKLKPTDESIKSLNSDMKTNIVEIKAVNEKLDLFINILRPSLNRQNVVSLLQRQTSGRRTSLKEKLHVARDLLTVVAKLNVPLTRQDYRDLSKRLFADYVISTESLKRELWATLVAAANARSVTETKTHQLPEATITQAKEAGNYVESKTIDLSSKPSWENTIFNDCTIVISKPENSITLDGVRFIDCNFEAVENEINRQLIAAFLENTRSTVSATVDNINVTITFSPDAPKPQRSQAETTR